MRPSVRSLALLALIAPAVMAQDPVRLPGVQVTAAADAARRITGFVFDSAGNPVAGAEVIVPDLGRRVITGRAGTFRIDSVRKGKFDIRARKIGFGPQWREVVVDSVSGYVRFDLVPVVTALPPMVSSAAQRGLSGNVADMGLHAVPGATVRALGTGLIAKTDAEGNFFLPVETGRYMVAIAKDSFATKLVSVAIPADSGRHLNAWLMPGFKVEKAHVWNVEDLQARQAWTRPNDRILFTREDLAGMNIEWIYDAVATTGPRFKFKEPISRDCMVIVNGGPEIANLNAVTIEDVESVEVYASLSKEFPTVAAAAPQSKLAKPEILKNAPKVQGGQFIWLSNTRNAAFENRTRICPGIYIWTR